MESTSNYGPLPSIRTLGQKYLFWHTPQLAATPNNIFATIITGLCCYVVCEKWMCICSCICALIGVLTDRSLVAADHMDGTNDILSERNEHAIAPIEIKNTEAERRTRRSDVPTGTDRWVLISVLRRVTFSLRPPTSETSSSPHFASGRAILSVAIRA